MKIFTKLVDAVKKDPRPKAVALGMFDGLHLGHRSIVKRAAELVESANGIVTVLTFSNHPLTVLAADNVPAVLCARDTKVRLFRELGVDVLFFLPFTKEFSRISPENFLAMLRDNIAPQYVVTGGNYTFGAYAKGNRRTLVRYSADYGFAAEICPTVTVAGKTVSSTRIREAVITGDLAVANTLLGAPFTYGGNVVHGDRRGRTLGFPTANLIIEKNRAMLPNGAYAARVLCEGERFFALANVGDNPTFAGEERRLEVNLQDFSRDIYGKFIEVEFLGKLRDEQKFSDVDALVRQLNRDKKNATTFWGVTA